MTPQGIGLRRARALIFATLVLLATGLAACTPGDPDEQGDGLELSPDFREPVALRSQDGVLEVGLTAEQSSARFNTVAEPVEGMMLFAWELMQGRSDGPTSGSNEYPAPTLVVDPGDRLILHVSNELSGLTIPDLVDPILTPAGDEVPLTPRIIDATPINLHTHGLHVSPNLNSDNVLIEFDPGQANTYTYDIPADHPQGVYWYHPHRHQLTEEQVYRGLAGLIVIGRPAGVIPRAAENALPVRLMALQSNFVSSRAAGMNQLNYPAWPQMISTWEDPPPGSLEAGEYEPSAAPVNFPDSPRGTTFTTNWFTGPLSAENKRGAFQFMPQNLLSFTAEDPAVDSPADPSYPDHLRDFQITVNGQFQPVLRTAPGQTEVWVVANIGSQPYLNVGIRSTATGELVPLRVLATDGNPVPTVMPGSTNGGTTYLLPSASRVALAVTMPDTGGLQLELPPVSGASANHTQPLETEGIRYTSNGDGTNPSGVLGEVSIAPEHVNWFDGFKSTPTQILAEVEPAGDAVEPVEFAVGEVLGGDSAYRDLADSPVDRTREFTIGGGASPLVDPEDPNGFMYMFDGTTWPTTPVIHPRLNSVEEWRFRNTNNDQHPLHIHVNNFEIVSLVDPVQGTSSGPLMYSVDNFNVPAPSLGPDEAVIEPGELRLRSSFKDFLGTFVTHCHRLDHEDNGLMMTVNIIPEVSTIATVAAGREGAEVVVRDQATGSVLGTAVPFPGTDALPTTAMADIDGDAVLDLIVGRGPGGPPTVVAYSGAGPEPFSRELAQFEAFESDFAGGVSVAAGLISGDPTRNNIIVGSGPGRDTEITVFASELPAEVGGAPTRIATYSPIDGDGGVRVASGLVSAGRFSIIAAPADGDLVRVHQFPLLGDANSADSVRATPQELGDPVLVDEFDAFSDYAGPVSLATGWIAAEEGGAESIVVGQASNQGTVRVFSWATNLNGQSPMYVESFHRQHEVDFGATLTFDPLRGPVSVATTSTTNGADLIISGQDGDRSVANVYRLQRSPSDPGQLAAELRETVMESGGALAVTGG